MTRSLILLGGAIATDRRTIRIARSLGRTGEVDVLCLDARPEDAERFDDGVRILGLPGYDFRPRGLVTRLRPHRRFDAFAAAAPAGGIDLVLAVGLPTLRPAVRIAGERGARLVYDLREPYPHTVLREFRPSTALKRAILPFALVSMGRAALREEATLLPSVDLVIIDGEEGAEWLREKHAVADALLIRDYPLRREEVPGGSLRRDLGIAEADRIVMHRGPLSRGRGLVPLVRAAARLPNDVHVVLAGRGTLESRLRLSADIPDLAERVHFTGPVSPGDRPAVDAAADLGVALGDRRPTGAACDFLAAGVPVLATEDAGPGSVLTRYDAGWVTAATSSTDIAIAVTDALGDPTELARRGANGRRAHLEELHWEAEEERLSGAIEGLRS